MKFESVDNCFFIQINYKEVYSLQNHLMLFSEFILNFISGLHILQLECTCDEKKNTDLAIPASATSVRSNMRKLQNTRESKR